MQTIAIDNETHLITRERPAPRVVCSTVSDGAVPDIAKIGEGLEDLWRGLLEDDEIELVGLNVAYDTTTIAATYPNLLPLVFEKYRKNLITDVGIRQQLLDIASGKISTDERVKYYSLAALVELAFDERMGGKDGPDVWRLRYAELEDVPLAEWPVEAVDYPLEDARQTWRVWDAQNEYKEYIRYEHERAYTAFCLRLMECRGMRTDARAVREFRERNEKEMDRLRPELVEAGLVVTQKKKGQTVYVKNMKAARERVIAGCLEQGVDPPLTPTGKQRARKDRSFSWRDEPRFVAVDKVAALMSRDPDLAKKIKYSLAEKNLSTYAPVVEAGITGPVTTSFGIAATGRTTSSTPWKPMIGSNLQNAPRDGGLRECFKARDGYVYLAADYSGAELHTLAQTCKDKLGYSCLGDALASGRDVHLTVGAQLLGISYDEAKERLASGDEEVQNARQDAKAANFGFPGGMRERTFMLTQIKQRGVFWEFDRVVELREAWLGAFPEMPDYFDYCERELGPHREALVELAGSRMLRLVKSLTVCANTHFQALAGTGALAAVCEVSRRSYVDKASGLYRSRPCNFVHDEIILETPIEGAWSMDEKAMELKTTMENEFNKFVPDYPVTVEPVYMRRWAKKAKPVFDDQGRLTIWEG
jgi:DNA polymerase I-like protein with 3'-5' exonuclease and polymerase domains